jgi:ribonuclease M5
MIKINEVVIVEGKYDKIKLSSIIDAVIIETNGFSIFKDKEQLELIRRLASTKGILIITDSDAAGFKIRNFLTGAIPKGQVKQAYIPDIFGKEHRKSQVSKEGKLGVEGVPKSAIIKSLENAGVLCGEISEPSKKITKTDLFEDGLTGGEGSSEKRQRLLKSLNLPMRLSTNSMLDVLNAMMDFVEYKKFTDELQK